MHTDPISDLLTRIRNSAKAHKSTTTAPYSKMKESILKIMKRKNFIDDYKIEKEKSYKILNIILSEKTSNLKLIKISKPGQRIYIKKEDLKPVKKGLGISIISTSKGVMSNTEAHKQNLGGEVICKIF